VTLVPGETYGEAIKRIRDDIAKHPILTGPNNAIRVLNVFRVHQ